MKIKCSFCGNPIIGKPFKQKDLMGKPINICESCNKEEWNDLYDK